jgi:hypothetical protein
MAAVPFVPSIAAEKISLGVRIGAGANGAVFAAELRGAHGVVQVCAKVGRPCALGCWWASAVVIGFHMFCLGFG